MAVCQVGERAGPPNFHHLLEKAQPGCGEVLRLCSGIKKGFVKDIPWGPGLSWSCLGVQPETRTPSLGCHMQPPSRDPGGLLGHAVVSAMFSPLCWVWARQAQGFEEGGWRGLPRVAVLSLQPVLALVPGHPWFGPSSPTATPRRLPDEICMVKFGSQRTNHF